MLSLSYQASEDVLLYTSLSRGVKAGGLSTSITPAGVNPEVEPEVALNAEVGVKSTFADRTVQLNFNLFWTDIDNYQTTIRDQVLLASYLANAEKVRVRGFEFDASVRPVDGLRLYELALERGITIGPGYMFSVSNSYRHFIRLNYSTPWSKDIEQAVITVGKLAATCARLDC